MHLFLLQLYYLFTYNVFIHLLFNQLFIFIFIYLNTIFLNIFYLFFNHNYLFICFNLIIHLFSYNCIIYV